MHDFPEPYPGYGDACSHWARIRAALPPFKFPPRTPDVTIDLTDNETCDVDTFKRLRAHRLSRSAHHA